MQARILLIGGSGFVGRHVAEWLTREGAQVTIASRTPQVPPALATLPGVSVARYDVYDSAALTRLVAGHDAVVNLVGILHGKHLAFERAHVTLVETLSRAMLAAGVTRLVHLSALGADPHGPSDYQQSKARGERVLAQGALAYTILRPSVIFGAGDSFLTLFARLQACLPVLPLAGAYTRFAPVWVMDVAHAVCACLTNRATVGQTLELAGPHHYTLAQLVRYAGQLAGHRRVVVPLPRSAAMLQAALFELLPGAPLISRDNVRSLDVDNVSLAPFPRALLGFGPTALEAVAPYYLGQAGRNARNDRWREGT